MILHNEIDKSVVIENEKLSFTLDYSNGLKIGKIIHQLSGINWLLEPCTVFELTIKGIKYPASDFDIQKVNLMRDESRECISFELRISKPWCISARVSWMSEPENNDGGYSMILQLGAHWPEGCPEEIYLHIPLFTYFGNKENQWYLGARPQAAPDGTSVMPMGPHRPFDLPICNIAPDQQTGFAMALRDDSLVPIDWNHLRNGAYLDISSEEALRSNSVLLRLQNTPLTDVFVATFDALSGGWCEAFDCWRSRTRNAMDLSQYRRPDLMWYRKVLYQHFTFAYSKEVFNYETQQFEPERLLKDGEKFGGYDSVLLWYQYPRLGVDVRKQWDFNRDIPGGLPGMRDFTRACHQKGVRVFLPYKPWDIRGDESMESVLENVLEVLDQTEIDGIWFDTMDSVPDGFRRRIDALRPGIMFCTEGYPAFPQNLEQITGHFDQFAESEPMPHSHLFRYLLPENNAPAAARWKIGAGKDELIKRAVFNGTGIVIWQDVFGAWLPFSAQQQAVMKKWKSILLEHFDTYFGSRPIPMYPVMQEGLYANRFSADDGNEVIYSLYNGTELPIKGRLLMVHDEQWGVRELWNNSPVVRNGNYICGSIDSGQIMVIAASASSC